MNLQDYKYKQELYKSFAEIIRKILLAAIHDASANGPYKYHLQQIQFRAKTPESLEKRLIEQGNEGAENIENIRNDLAGCRVIFYYNDDINAFLNSGLVRDNFKIHWEKSKVHGPKDEFTSTNDFYIANHYIVELDDNRASLPEYDPFKGLKCEVQIQTVLNHAWAETAHDITYKKPETSGFGKRVLDAIEKRLQKIMQDYLKPAGYEFQKVQYDYLRFLEGKVLFDRNVKQEIITCRDNNERHEILERFRKSTLPLYDIEYITKELNTILEIVRTAVNSAIDIKPVEINTPIGLMKGRTLKDILDVSLSILNFIQYADVESVFSCLLELYLKHTDEKEKDLILKSTVKLVGYDIDVFQKAGFFVQDVVLMQLEHLDIETLNYIKKLVAAVGNEVLNPSIEGTSSNYKSISIKHGSIPGSDVAANIRSRALSLLKKVYEPQNPEDEKRYIIRALKKATLTPSMAIYSDKLLEIVLRDCIEIIDFYISIIPSENYEILESIENDICFLYQRAKDIVKASKIKDANCLENCNILIENAMKFRKELNSDQVFVIYKTLVGYESVFDESWNNNEWRIRGEKEYREQKSQDFLNNITDENEDFWEKIIIRCAQTKTDDLATFPYFGKFLNSLAARKPDFILYLLTKHEEVMSNFLCAILDGLLRGSAKSKALSLIDIWVNKGKYLYACARVFEYYQPLNEQVVKKVLDKAKTDSDEFALIGVMAVAAKNFEPNKPHLIDELFLPAVQGLTTLSNAKWVFDLWYRPECSRIIAALDERGIDIVLENLLLLENIDYHAEEILKPIASQYPKKILAFFRTRLKVKKDDGELASALEAIPFNFHCLFEPLSTFPEIVVSTVSGWYDDDSKLFVYHGARLIHNIFPAFSVG